MAQIMSIKQSTIIIYGLKSEKLSKKFLLWKTITIYSNLLITRSQNMLLASKEDMIGGCENLLQEIMETEGRWFTDLYSCLWK